ncbi:hypothetical protein vseg_015686 [Gypsophila vaccaria]
MLLRWFTNSAFASGYEASIYKGPIDVNLVRFGALVTFVQKGIQYSEMEANVNNVYMEYEAMKHDTFKGDIYQVERTGAGT